MLKTVSILFKIKNSILLTLSQQVPHQCLLTTNVPGTHLVTGYRAKKQDRQNACPYGGYILMRNNRQQTDR